MSIMFTIAHILFLIFWIIARRKIDYIKKNEMKIILVLSVIAMICNIIKLDILAGRIFEIVLICVGIKAIDSYIGYLISHEKHK